ncbi:MAG TPA: hypothetical protein DD727_01875, partial [Clostridiales bacterium]|nr:hypothetical protein [Clostridiales bacterium]
MDRNEALSVLGLGADATPDDVERRYAILMKRNDQVQRESGETESAEFVRQTRAYQFLTLGELPEETRPRSQSEKLGNFWHYYKAWILILPVVLVFFGYLLADAFL